MRRAGPLLLALVLAGCVGHVGDATVASLHQVHRFAEGPREAPFRVGEADRIDARLWMEPDEACVVHEPPRIVLLDPHGREALALEPGGDCRGLAEDARIPAPPGTWTVRFVGDATILASATIRVVDDPDRRAHVPAP